MPGNVLTAIIDADVTGLSSGVNKSVNDLDKLEKAYSGLGKQGVISIGKVEVAMKDLKAGIKSSTNPADIQKLNEAYSFLEKKLVGLKAAAGESTFEGVSRGTLKANAVSLQFAHTLGLFPPQVSNLTHSFDSLIQAYEQMEAQTGSSKAAFKGLGSALIGPLGIGLAISAVIAGIELFGGKLFEASEGQKALQKSIDDSAKKFGEEAVKLTALTGLILNNNTSNADRTKALKAINEQYKEYLGNLGIEEVNLGNINTAYEKIIDSIVKQAVVKGIQDEISASVEKTAKSIISLGIEEEKRKAKSASASQAAKNQLSDEDKKRKQLEDGLNSFRSVTNSSTDATVRQNQVLDAGTKKISSYDERVKLLKESLTKELQPLLNLTTNFEDLGIKLDKVSKSDAGTKVIEQAKKIAAFLSKNNQDLSIQFDVDPNLDEAANVARAESFLKKAYNFVQHGANEFAFKADPLQLFFKNFGFKFDTSTFEKIVEEKVPKTYDEVKRAFEKNIKHLAENNPIVISTTATLKEPTRDQVLKNGGSVKINADFEPTFDANGNFQTSIDKALADLNKKFIGIVESFQTSVFDAIGEGIGQGLATGNFSQIFSGIFQAVGQALQSLGQALIGTAIGLKAIKAAFKTLNPAVALGAGIALIALGAIIKSSIGNISTGARAAGGPVAAGRPIIVGEMGREIFVPNTGGRIISNSNISQGRQVSGSSLLGRIEVSDAFIDGYKLKLLLSLVDKSQSRLA